MTTTESVAQAIYDKNAAAATGRLPWAKATSQVKDHFRDLARVAIETMGLVPTEEPK